MSISELVSVDWAAKGTGPMIEALSEYYLHSAGNATPRKVRPLLQYLARVTAKAKFASGPTLGAAQPQFSADWKAYADRLMEYGKILDLAWTRGPDLSSPELAEGVVMPLVAGWYRGSDVRGVPDAANAVILSRQVGVARESLAQAWDGLMSDLTLGLSDRLDIAGDVKKFLGGAAVMGLAYGVWRVSRDLKG